MLISFTNKTNLPNDTLSSIIKAINKQIILHYAPAWNQIPATLKIYQDESKIPGYAWKIFITNYDGDNCINISNIQNYLFDIKETVSTLISHKVLELFNNRFNNLQCTGLLSEGGLLYNVKICDPVKNDFYAIEVAKDTESGFFKVENNVIVKNPENTEIVLVKNFVFPSWFNPNAQEFNYPYDYLKKLNASFKASEGGILPLVKV